jgi:anti-sigma factor RsiW
MTAPISELDLHAFIDGELPAARAAAVQQALDADAGLAARAAAFRADKAALAAAFAPIAAAPVPRAWVERIERAATPAPSTAPRARRRAIFALAACLMLALGAAAWVRSRTTADSILAQADAARTAAALHRITGDTLTQPGAADTLLATTIGLRVRAPDLHRLGWQLTELDTLPAAAMLRYRSQDGHDLTLYVRRSNGTPRFDLLRSGKLRTCIWQDEVIGAVLTGDMSAGQMMRVASAAYVALSL